MTDALEDVATDSVLTPTQVVELQRAIEAGLLAREARESGAGFADATDLELRLLEDQGALARQRFIQANLGLVGMVSRQFAARSQLPDAELFQEGCVGFPLVNYLPVAPHAEPECQLVNHVALVQLDSLDTEPMDACNALTAPSEGVWRGHVNGVGVAQSWVSSAASGIRFEGRPFDPAIVGAVLAAEGVSSLPRSFVAQSSWGTGAGRVASTRYAGSCPRLWQLSRRASPG